jgi:hypothetical protein
MKLFNKPKWLKPEINELKYYVHTLILAAVALLILENLTAITTFNFSGLHLIGTMFNIKNILLSIPILTIADIVAHTTTGLN